jgi:hypothetical protein
LIGWSIDWQQDSNTKSLCLRGVRELQPKPKRMKEKKYEHDKSTVHDVTKNAESLDAEDRYK